MTLDSRRSSTALRLGSALIATLLTGCTLGPDPTVRPVAPVDENATWANAPGTTAGPVDDDHDPAPWWLAFGDPVTTELVERALGANADLAGAAARLAAAEAGLRSARSSLWPSAEASFSVARNKSSFVLPQTGRVGILSTTFSDQVSISYQVDLFGRLARTRQAAWAELLATRDAREAVEHALVAGVVRSRVAVAANAASLELARSTLESWERSAALIERRYEAGLADALDLRLARQSRESARAAVPEQEAALARSRHALDVLLGRRPGTGEPLPELAGLPALEPPPVGLPIEVLDRRPDVRASERRFQAATARVGVALANLFPSLRLTGAIGNSSSELSDLLSSETVVYNAVAGLAAPLFQGGRLRAEVAAARARADEAVADYSSTVLTALREAEDALVTDAARRASHQATVAAAEEANEGARLAWQRYERGTGPLLAFLEAERRRFSTEAQRIRARADLWTGRVDLHLALGGDWTPSETTPLASATPSNPSPPPSVSPEVSR